LSLELACAELVYREREGASIWLSAELATDSVIDAIANPDALLTSPGCEIVKDQPKIKVGCLPVRFGDRSLRLYIKRYNMVFLRHKVGSLFVRSGARRAMRGAAVVLEAGIETAKPVAAVERRRWGMLSASFYLTEEVPGGKTANAYWLENLRPLAGIAGVRRRRAFVRALAALFAHLHARDIYHNDLKDFNILVAPKSTVGESFYLLDLEGVRRFGQLSRRRRVKNLVQLNRTLGKLVSGAEAMRFLKCYLETQSEHPIQSKTWARSIVKQSRAVDRQKLAEPRIHA
jgi:hypothetical protein